MYSDHIHARSLDSGYHPSRTWVKNFWSEIRYYIPAGYRIVGENVYATHSIKYTDLSTYFYGISAWEDDTCLAWDETLALFKDLNITPVPELARGEWYKLQEFIQNWEDGESEGYVVRDVSSFSISEFRNHVAKYVREDHVRTDDHWMTTAMERNETV